MRNIGFKKSRWAALLLIHVYYPAGKPQEEERENRLGPEGEVQKGRTVALDEVVIVMVM